MKHQNFSFVAKTIFFFRKKKPLLMFQEWLSFILCLNYSTLAVAEEVLTILTEEGTKTT